MAQESSGGTITDAFRYDAYGQTVATFSVVGGSGLLTSWRYQGRLNVAPDGAEPLYANGARLYSPSLGTFTQLDTVSGKATNPLSMNRFLYAEANPATFIDPSGHVAMHDDGGSAGTNTASTQTPTGPCTYDTSSHGLTGAGCTRSQRNWNADDKPRADSSNCHPSNQNEANNCSSYGTTSNPNEVSNWEFHKNQYKLDHPDKPRAQRDCGFLGSSCYGDAAKWVGDRVGDAGRWAWNNKELIAAGVALGVACFLACAAVIPALGVAMAAAPEVGLGGAIGLFCASACPDAAFTLGVAVIGFGATVLKIDLDPMIGQIGDAPTNGIPDHPAPVRPANLIRGGGGQYFSSGPIPWNDGN